MVLITLGLRGHRYGETPYCGACGYNLTGSVAERCPECGSTFLERDVVFGQQTRRPVVIGLGCAALVLSGLGILGSLNQVDWYQWCPDFLVISNLRSSNRSTASRALVEVKRRLQDGELSSFSRLAEACLAEQGATQPAP